MEQLWVLSFYENDERWSLDHALLFRKIHGSFELVHGFRPIGVQSLAKLLFIQAKAQRVLEENIDARESGGVPCEKGIYQLSVFSRRDGLNEHKARGQAEFMFCELEQWKRHKGMSNLAPRPGEKFFHLGMGGSATAAEEICVLDDRDLSAWVSLQGARMDHILFGSRPHELEALLRGVRSCLHHGESEEAKHTQGDDNSSQERGPISGSGVRLVFRGVDEENRTRHQQRDDGKGAQAPVTDGYQNEDCVEGKPKAHAETQAAGIEAQSSRLFLVRHALQRSREREHEQKNVEPETECGGGYGAQGRSGAGENTGASASLATHYFAV